MINSINSNFQNTVAVCMANAATVAHDNNQNNQNNQEDKISDVMTAEPELKKPPKYAVIMYNDDYTPMDFVVDALMFDFKHTEDEAVQIMLNIHNKGKGIAGVYNKDIAETKASNVNSRARLEGFPLMTQIEPSQD